MDQEEVLVLKGRMPKPKRRLTKIRPREVSLVDEAANQRSFIMVKNKDGGAPVGKKNSEILKDAGTEPVVEPTEGKDGGGENQPIEKVLTAEMKAQVSGFLNSAMEELMSIASEVEALPPEGGAIAIESIQGMANIGQSLIELASSIAELYSQDGVAANKSADSLENSLIVLEKAGKKMSGARLEKFQSALTALQELLKEIAAGDSPEKSKGQDRKVRKNEGGTTVDKKDEKKVEKSTEAGASASQETVTQETQAAPVTAEATQPAPAAVAAPAAPAVEAAPAEGFEAAIEKALKPFGEKLETVTKALEKSEGENKALKEKVESLEKAASPSNSESPEGETEKEVETTKGKNIWGGLFS